MKPGALWLVLWVSLAAEAIRGDQEHLPEPVGTSVREAADLIIFEAILPGELVDWGVVPTTRDPRSLVMLLEMEDDSRQVVRWDLAGDGKLEELGSPLAKEVETLIPFGSAEDRGGGFLLAAGGVLLALSPDGDWQRQFESPYDLFPISDTRGSQPALGQVLILRSVGLLQALAPDAAGGDLRPIWEFELPLRVDREWGGLRLETPPVSFLDLTAEGEPRLVLGPEAHGKRRVRSVLLTASRGGVLASQEAWSMLPTAEDIEESWYVELNGKPALIVSTVMAEKHGVFEKKKLRLFELAVDRTRSGSGPLLEVMTRSRNWYGTCAGIADLNGDGLDDVVSAQPKGLGAGSLWVETYLARSAGGFEPKARGSEIEVEEGEVCTLASDLDGDGQVELVVVEGDSLLVFPLIRQPESKVVVADRPRWRVSFDDIDGRPRPVELFGQPTTQMLVTGHTEGKRQAVRVVRLR